MTSITATGFLLCSLMLKLVACASFNNLSVLLTSGEPSKVTTKVLIASGDNLEVFVNNREFDHITIENQTITKLEKNTIGNLPTVVTLKIIRSKVSQIAPGTFKNLPKLEEIFINNNEISTIKTEVFNKLSVRILDLKKNGISAIENGALGGHNLEELYLDDNMLSKWDSSWLNGAVRIQLVSVSGNHIRELHSDSFKFSKTVQSLNISRNEITKISENAFRNLQQLTRIDLSFNFIKNLESVTFSGVKQLQELLLHDNKISEFSWDLFENVAIMHLDLQNNQLSCLPDGLEAVKGLKKLNFEHNMLSCDCVNSWRKSMEEILGKIHVSFDESNCLKRAHDVGNRITLLEGEETVAEESSLIKQFWWFIAFIQQMFTIYNKLIMFGII